MAAGPAMETEPDSAAEELALEKVLGWVRASLEVEVMDRYWMPTFDSQETRNLKAPANTLRVRARNNVSRATFLNLDFGPATKRTQLTLWRGHVPGHVSEGTVCSSQYLSRMGCTAVIFVTRLRDSSPHPSAHQPRAPVVVESSGPYRPEAVGAGEAFTATLLHSRC
jgi:hypothetical protein